MSASYVVSRLLPKFPLVADSALWRALAKVSIDPLATPTITGRAIKWATPSCINGFNNSLASLKCALDVESSNAECTTGRISLANIDEKPTTGYVYASPVITGSTGQIRMGHTRGLPK